MRNLARKLAGVWNLIGRFLLGDSIVEQSAVVIASRLSDEEREVLSDALRTGAIHRYFHGGRQTGAYCALVREGLVSYIPVQRDPDDRVAPIAILVLTQKGQELAEYLERNPYF